MSEDIGKRRLTLIQASYIEDYKINIKFDDGWDYCKDDIYIKLSNVDTDNEHEVIAFLERYKNAM